MYASLRRKIWDRKQRHCFFHYNVDICKISNCLREKHAQIRVEDNVLTHSYFLSSAGICLSSFPGDFSVRTCFSVTSQFICLLNRNTWLVYIQSQISLDINHMKIPQSQRAILLLRACFVKNHNFNIQKKSLLKSYSLNSRLLYPNPMDRQLQSNRIRILM